ncbi:MAG: hypothetical protein H0V43_07175 [Gemmatimonadales bacterium]|nr:hypothetical protein [Gemmatimonadales bacterium]
MAKEKRGADEASSNGHQAASAEEIAGFITRSMLEAPPARATSDVYVKEFDRHARLQALTNEEAERFGVKVGKKDGDQVETDNVGFRAKYIAECWIDPDSGERVVQPEEWQLIARLRPQTVNTLFRAASKLNTLLESDLEEQVDTLKKTDAASG